MAQSMTTMMMTMIVRTAPMVEMTAVMYTGMEGGLSEEVVEEAVEKTQVRTELMQVRTELTHVSH